MIVKQYANWNMDLCVLICPQLILNQVGNMGDNVSGSVDVD